MIRKKTDTQELAREIARSPCSFSLYQKAFKVSGAFNEREIKKIISQARRMRQRSVKPSIFPLRRSLNNTMRRQFPACGSPVSH